MSPATRHLAVSAFVAALPKVELHLHLVGSASPATILDLSRRHPEAGLPVTPAALSEFYEFRDFPHFLDVYRQVAGVVRGVEDVELLVLGLAGDAAGSNVRYAEVTVTPIAHFLAGISHAELSDALSASRELAADRFGVRLNWIFDIPGPYEGWAEATTAFALGERPEGTVALGLAGPEKEAPRAGFAEFFADAARAGLHRVVHAGETTGPDEVWSALRDLGAERIGHGIGAADDMALLDHLRDNDITLELCPTSNVRTRAVDRIEDHPLPALVRHGVPVALSTDDPGMFGTDLNREYQLVADTFGMSQADLVDLARAGVRAAYCDPALREDLLADLDAVR